LTFAQRLLHYKVTISKNELLRTKQKPFSFWKFPLAPTMKEKENVKKQRNRR